MKPEQWKTYRTRFLVKAKQLSSTLSFIDHLGRQHRGCKGDYLVESSDGVLSIAPRRIFEDIYVAMSYEHQLSSESSETIIAESAIDETTIGVPEFSQASIDRVRFEPLAIEELKLPKTATARPPLDDQPVTLRNSEAAAVQRKLPQPCRDRRGSVETMRLM